MLNRESRERRMAALTKLAIRTREKVERETFVVYVEDTAMFDTAIVELACHRIGTSQTWFPKVNELIEECKAVAKQRQEQRESEQRKQLPPAPISPEKWAEIQARFRDVLRRKAMR